MLTKQIENTIIVRLDKGEEILSCLREVCATYGVRAASITGIGAVKGTTIGMYDLETGRYSDLQLPSFLELTNLSGNVSTLDGAPFLHVHVTLADEHGHAFGGHLKQAFIGATAEIFFTVFDTNIDRAHDDATGLNTFHW